MKHAIFTYRYRSIEMIESTNKGVGLNVIK